MNSRCNLVLLVIAVVVCVPVSYVFAADAADLKPSLRDDVLVTIYAPGFKSLLDHIGAFVPQGQQLTMQSVTWLSQMGLPKDETLAAPLAFMVFTAADEEKAHVVLLFGVKPGEWLKAMGDPGDDGIFDVGDGFLMGLPDAVATAPERDSLLAYKKLIAAPKPYTPTANAAK
ncbi:MAG TPA: hypothetical protein VM223_19715, partial [Planctomycetota bacterium]|nr:hypothetical protein [Planctomycetota bacterium]